MSERAGEPTSQRERAGEPTSQRERAGEPTSQRASGPRTDAVRAYKDVIGELDAASEALRERERRQVAVLRQRLEELVVVAADAERTAVLARLTVELAWDRVVDELWHEGWMTLRAHPRPAADADPDDLDALVGAAERAEEAIEAARRRAFGFGR